MILTCVLNHIPLQEYTPTNKASCNRLWESGQTTSPKMVKIILNLNIIPKPDDAADVLQPPSVAPILTMIYFINYLLNNGVPQETIILILMLPIIATIIAFSRQIIGIKTFGIYTPLIITFVFLAIDIRYGIIVFITVLLAGSLVRKYQTIYFYICREWQF